MDRKKLWDEVNESILSCTRCRLYKGRKNAVPGEGNKEAKVMFIGEGPGGEEDATGRPFVGRAGQLLDKMIESIQLKREEVYIANIVKCRPPSNRVPREDEAQACLPYLRRQVFLIRPKILVCLGSTALKHIVDKEAKITQVRGKWIHKKGYHIMPTYHPAALLRDSQKKYEAWEDLKKIRELILRGF